MDKKLTKSILSNEDAIVNYESISPTTCTEQEKYNTIEKGLLRKIDFRYSCDLFI